MIRDQAAKTNYVVLVDFLKPFRLAVITDIRSACKQRPWHVGQLAADESIVLRRCRAERDVGLAFGKVEDPVHHHEFNAQPG